MTIPSKYTCETLFVQIPSAVGCRTLGVFSRVRILIFINATIGFTKLSDVTHRSAKSRMRMIVPIGLR
jgi:hypothetical protein